MTIPCTTCEISASCVRNNKCWKTVMAGTDGYTAGPITGTHVAHTDATMVVLAYNQPKTYMVRIDNAYHDGQSQYAFIPEVMMPIITGEPFVDVEQQYVGSTYTLKAG